MDFNQIPNDWRVPLAYIEFDNSAANQGAASSGHKRVLIGQQLATATVAVGTMQRITQPDQADQLFGQGSMLAEMLRASMVADRMIETWAVGLADDAAGVKAAGAITVTAAPSVAGSLALYIAGTRVRVGIAADATEAEVATAITAAINTNPRLPLTAEVDGTTAEKVNLVCRWKGETGNALDIRVNYYAGEQLPAGLLLTITAMASGAANPDIAPAIAAFGDTWFKTLAMPYTDSANLDALRDELLVRFGPMVSSDGVAYAAFRGSHAATATFGSSRNDHVLSFMGTNTSPTPPYIWAAVNAAIASYYLNMDPARPLQTLVLPGILPPAVADRWDDIERNLHLFDGISTYAVNAASQVQIEAQITNYQVNSFGSEDPSYLYVNTPATLCELRVRTRAWVTQTFPRHKLRADGKIPPGVPIVTPSIFRDAYYGGVAKPAEEDGLIENAAELVANMILEIDSNNPNRLNALTTPNLVNQFRMYAERMQFRV